MKLHVGERLSAAQPGQQTGNYVVTGIVRETSWSGLYTGKKILRNFDFTAKRPRETDDKEWLDVLIRTIEYPELDSRQYVDHRRALARAEAHAVGRRHGQFWPEPVDFLEIANTRDAFLFHAEPKHDGASSQEPIVVFAHPHGQPLDDWQKQVLPLASLLSVLAELLELVSQAHGSGMILNGLQPDVIWVDRTNRVHFLGTDTVLTTGEAMSCLHHPGSDGDHSRQLFSPLRNARGFAAPECFDPSFVPDFRSDLYAWGALAYLLLTGEDPGRIAAEQGQAWASFERGHFASLERSFRALPPSHVRNWAEQIGVDPDSLARDWPGNALAAFGQLLHAHARRRPASVDQLRAWLINPPPEPVATAVVVHLPDGHATLLIDPGAAAPELDMTVRRRATRPSETMEQGDVVYQGPLIKVVEDKSAPADADACYSVFTRPRSNAKSSSSVPTYAELVWPDKAKLVYWAERQASRATTTSPEPVSVGLLYQVLNGVEASEALLESSLPAVRGWAIHRLAAMPSRHPDVLALLWCALLDPIALLRLEAARGILKQEATVDDQLVRRLVDVLGHGDIDDAIEAARSLAAVGLADNVIERTMASLEGDRSTTCPVCRLELADRDRPGHLREAHGYIDVFGSLLPRETAVERLWDRVFIGADQRANERLRELFSGVDNSQTRDFVSALETATRARFPGGADRSPADRSLLECDGLMACLRKVSDPALPGELLRCRDARLREVGRDLLLPSLTEIAGRRSTIADLRSFLDQAIPEELLEEKIVLCLRLANMGLEAATANACLAQLQLERPVFCSECRARVPLVELETHLRRAHGILEFRGVRRPFADMKGYLLERICAVNTDATAWKALEDIARDRFPEDADARLLFWLGQGLREIDREHRPGLLASLGELLAGTNAAGRWLVLLSAPHKLPAMQALRRWLALEIAARLPRPADAGLTQPLRSLLADKLLPREAKQRAMVGLLRALGPGTPALRELLLAYLTNTGKVRSVEKLRELERLAGQSPEIDRLSSELEDEVRMDCPRCRVQLRRKDMVHHLWDRHRLVLDGRTVRDPWRVMEDWLEDYRLEKDQAVLDRCRAMAGKLNPERGVRRLQRLMLRHGIEDREALAALLERAREKRVSLCPHCYGRVPIELVATPHDLHVFGNNLAGFGYRLKLSEKGLYPRMQIETPDEVVFDGWEPGRFLTRIGTLVFFVVPLVLACFIAVAHWTAGRLPASIPMVLALGVGLVASGLVYLVWPTSRSIADRLVDAAWTKLVADNFSEELTKSEADFLAGLARASRDHGDPQRRAEPLQKARDSMEELARRDTAYVSHLATLVPLAVEDDAHFEQDPCKNLADALGECFTGQMPLAYADQLMKELKDKASEHEAPWSRAQFRRLGILLCDQAFNAGLEPSDLVDIGLVVPSLRDVLPVDDLEKLTTLRHLWQAQMSRDWERIGPAVTVFELAQRRKLGNRALETFPDLLLAVEGVPLNLCQRGVWFQDLLFSALPDEIEVRSRRGQSDSDYELVIGAERFRFDDDPEKLARLLEKWFRFYFKDFMVQAGSAPGRRSPDAMRELLARNGVPCPECKTHILPRPGEVGITLDEKIVPTWI